MKMSEWLDDEPVAEIVPTAPPGSTPSPGPPPADADLAPSAGVEAPAKPPARPEPTAPAAPPAPAVTAVPSEYTQAESDVHALQGRAQDTSLPVEDRMAAGRELQAAKERRDLAAGRRPPLLGKPAPGPGLTGLWTRNDPAMAGRVKLPQPPPERRADAIDAIDQRIAEGDLRRDEIAREIAAVRATIRPPDHNLFVSEGHVATSLWNAMRQRYANRAPQDVIRDLLDEDKRIAVRNAYFQSLRGQWAQQAAASGG